MTQLDHAHQHDRNDIIDWAHQLDDGLTPAAITTAFDQIQRLDDTELPTTDPDSTRELFTTWATELLSDRP